MLHVIPFSLRHAQSLRGIALPQARWHCVDPRSLPPPPPPPHPAVLTIISPQWNERPVAVISFSSPLRLCLARPPKPDRHDIRRGTAPELRLGRVCYRSASPNSEAAMAESSNLSRVSFQCCMLSPLAPPSVKLWLVWYIGRRRQIFYI